MAEMHVLAEGVRPRRPLLETLIKPEVLRDRSAHGQGASGHPVDPAILASIAHGLVHPGSSDAALAGFGQGNPSKNPANPRAGPRNEIDEVARGSHGLRIIKGPVHRQEIVGPNADVVVQEMHEVGGCAVHACIALRRGPPPARDHPNPALEVEVTHERSEGTDVVARSDEEDLVGANQLSREVVQESEERRMANTERRNYDGMGARAGGHRRDRTSYAAQEGQ